MLPAPSLSRQDWLAAHVGAHDAETIGCRAPAVPDHAKTRMQRWMTPPVRRQRPGAAGRPAPGSGAPLACATRAGRTPDGLLIGELHQRGLDDAGLAAIARLPLELG
jgi:hypothetical protein